MQKLLQNNGANILKIMLYIRKLFTQDLRDGKQIAFPKEPSLAFFNFNYINNESDRKVSFIFKAQFGQFEQFDNKLIQSRLYAAGSESRMDGEVKAFIRDELNAQVNDLLIFKNKGTKYTDFEFMFVPQSNTQYYPLLLQLSNSDNHSVFGFDESQPEIERVSSKYRQFITAIKSKPFLLLAGISGTGKSRIVRELARSCWPVGSEEFKAQKPSNYEMVQVKPNWHDSSELIGYVSRIEGEKFIAGDFLKFISKAWENQDTPYFLCLDEMNLAPVEQYFAEYLSVIETRKADGNGGIKTDPILKSNEQWFFDLTASLPCGDEVRQRFNNEGITIPQNLIVIGTVNMDETTFSFSRKVLDRAMTIEMNEVNLDGGLDSKYEIIGKLEKDDLIGIAVEGVDVYSIHRGVCDKVIDYLKKINKKLEGTPFKIAYRTRNEFLLYVVNNLPYKEDENGEEWTEEEIIARALDEITNMKILSRIEGDESKVPEKLLKELSQLIKEELEDISGLEFVESEEVAEPDEDGNMPLISISLAKLDEMIKRLKNSGYTSFWA